MFEAKLTFKRFFEIFSSQKLLLSFSLYAFLILIVKGSIYGNIYRQSVRGDGRSIIGGGGGVFIHSCSQTVKTIDFKRN